MQVVDQVVIFSVIDSTIGMHDRVMRSWTRTRQSRLIDLMLMQSIARSVPIDCVPRIKDKLVQTYGHNNF